MLWSLIKILVFVVLVAAAAFGAGQLMEMNDGILITFGGNEYQLDALKSVIAIVLLVAAVWIGLKLLGLLIAVLKFINGDETAISRYFSRNRERKGFQALSEGMLALASGEGRLAMAKATKAQKYLNRPELTNLLTAQAAEMAGDKQKAETVYKQLLTDDRTRFVGVRGIMKQKLAAGETDTALALAEKAFAIKPKHEETQDILLKLQAETEDWAGARKTLNAKLQHGSLPRDVHKRRDAVLALSQAREIIDQDKDIEAQEAAIEANRLSPDLIPAAVMAAQSYIAQDKKRYAGRVLKKAWDVQPHPELASAYAAIEPEETAQARIKRFKTLTKSQPDHPETKMMMAELYIAAEDFPQARRTVVDLVESEPTARNLTIMAAVERGEGAEDVVVRGWLTKALNAPRGPKWVCQNCQHVHGTWAPTCSNCKSFDTLSWVSPPEAEIVPSSTQMLPMLVGAQEEVLPVEVEDVDAGDIVESDAVSSTQEEAPKEDAGK
ncbi:heme biosynthesis protein HemY [Algirhabdus cladophorae]|uniref:heme biosynthesis protein HemY n=1 Tax=Algirhabdus cladophorae TaxID=3377108 RepID=UPI003B849AF7